MSMIGKMALKCDNNSYLDIIVGVSLAVEVLEAVQNLKADIEHSGQGNGLLARLEELLNVRAKPRHDHEPE